MLIGILSLLLEKVLLCLSLATAAFFSARYIFERNIKFQEIQQERKLMGHCRIVLQDVYNACASSMFWDCNDNKLPDLHRKEFDTYLKIFIEDRNKMVAMMAELKKWPKGVEDLYNRTKGIMPHLGDHAAIKKYIHSVESSCRIIDDRFFTEDDFGPIASKEQILEAERD